MWGHRISEIRMDEKCALAELDALLAREGIKRDPHLDYIAGLYDDDADGELIAAGGSYANTLRCFAVDSAHQGEGIMNEVITHLVQRQISRGTTHLFVYTKPESERSFIGAGFVRIASAEGVVFMENTTSGFEKFLRSLEPHRTDARAAAIVMNANPFTNGHLHLARTARAACERLFVFVVSEDASFFPFADRISLVRAGLACLDGAEVLESSSYMISRAVFPSYFLPGDDAVSRAQAAIDAELFARVARAIGATTRYVGEEPTSRVTAVYNEVLCERLPALGVECVVVPRVAQGGAPVSASSVRKLLAAGRAEDTREMVPPSTYEYFFTDRGRAVAKELARADDVVHH